MLGKFVNLFLQYIEFSIYINVTVINYLVQFLLRIDLDEIVFIAEFKVSSFYVKKCFVELGKWI